MHKKLLIVGAGGHGREIAWLARDVGKHTILGFIDGNVPQGTDIGGLTVLGGNSMIADYPDAEITIAIGDLRRRKSVVLELLTRFPALQFATLVHPSAIHPDRLDVGEGSTVCAGSLISVNVSIGKHVLMNFKSAVGHDAKIGDYCTLGPGSLVCGASELEQGVEVGAGAVVRQRTRFAEGSMAAMGAIVMKDVPANAMVLGNPARPMQQLSNFNP
jgi:sugar O-acyltransferase (sialic acid O-acetyltransferase NeuD family)